MLISYSHKFIFFHIAKAGGTSVKEALKPYSEEPEKFKIRRPSKYIDNKPNKLYKIWESFLWHAKVADVKKEISESLYNSFYKFTFVRNPWDSQVSMYNFIIKEKSHIMHEVVKLMDFAEYLKWVIKTYNPYPKGATKLQKDIITDNEGKIIVDFIGRYENLENDFEYICRSINITSKLPHLNKSPHKNYRTYYNEKTKKLVEDYFYEDIKLFDYKF